MQIYAGLLPVVTPTVTDCYHCYRLLPTVRARKSRSVMGRLPPELTSGGYLFPAFLSPGFPSREAMKLRKLSFVNTNFRTLSVHFKAVFIAVSRFKCSLAKVRSSGIATAAMCGCVRMSVFFVRFCHPLRWKASAQSGAYSVEASKQGHCLSHSCGSMTPLPFRSGLRSRCPQMRQPG